MEIFEKSRKIEITMTFPCCKVTYLFWMPTLTSLTFLPISTLQESKTRKVSELHPPLKYSSHRNGMREPVNQPSMQGQERPRASTVEWTSTQDKHLF